MKLKLTILALIGLSFSGCTNPMHTLSPSEPAPAAKKRVYQEPTAIKSEAYSNTMKRVASGIKNDPNYNKIALNTAEKKTWFRDLTYRLWDRQITNSQFISEGLAKYPSHKYEFEFIVRGFSS